MSTFNLAKLRWTLDADGHTIVFQDGNRLDLGGADSGLIARVARLPQEYLDLGNSAADQKLDLQRAERERDLFKNDLETLRHRIDGISDESQRDRILVILQEDLERAINLLFRFAGALGIQAQGALYDEITELSSKYGMQYRAPDKAHDLLHNLDPTGGAQGVLDADIYNVKFNEDTGKLDITPAEVPEGISDEDASEK